MSNTIQIKRSSTSGSAPTAGQLAQGELAVNLADEALYTKDASNAVVKLNAPSIDDKNTGATKHVTIDASGNVGIGTSSIASGGAGTTNFNVHTPSAASVYFKLSNAGTGNTTSDGFDLTVDSSGNAYIYNRENGFIAFGTNNTERARIDSSGNLLVGATSGDLHRFVKNNSGNFAVGVENSATSNPFGLNIQYTGASPNGAGNDGIVFQDNAATRFIVRSNGGIANYSANNVNLSDRREKTNFAPAGEYLSKICAIPVQTFNYIDQNHEADPGLTLGVVAQDVQEVAPELVMESNWGTEEAPKQRLSIYQTDLHYALMKAIQELKGINDAQAQIITALTARVEALEAV
jgi:hypothetical protein